MLAAVNKLSAQGSGVVELTTRLVTQEVRRPPRAAPRCSLSLFPGLPRPRHFAARGRRRQHSAGQHCELQVIALEPGPHTAHAAGAAVASTTGNCVLRQRLLASVRNCIAVMLAAFPPLLLTALSL